MKSYMCWIIWLLAIPGLVLLMTFHDSQSVFLIGTIELILIAVVVNAFVILYSRRNWRANPYGRALMYSKISLAILCDLSLVIAVMGSDYEWRGVLRVLAFAGILIAQTRLLQLLFKVRNPIALEQYRENNPEEGRHE